MNKHHDHITVKLRRLELDDKSRLAQLANNKKVWDNLRDFIPNPYNETDAEDFIEQTSKELPPQNFGIEYQRELCGVVGVTPQKDVYSKTGEIGYWIGEEYWGRGISTAAVKLMVEYAFDALKLVRVFAGVFEHNIASMRVLEKNGFQCEAISRKGVIKNDMILDEHRYFKLSEKIV